MSQLAPIIIKKKKVVGGDGHHGGAWKVAYADFVTAMMAFFLLMWLLNATSEDQRKGLADFFDPSIPVSRNSAGGAGMLNGDAMMAPPDASSVRTEGVRARPTKDVPGKDEGEVEKSPDLPEQEFSADTQAGALGTRDGDKSAGGMSDEDSDALLNQLSETLRAEVSELGQAALLEHFTLRVTPEGLVIEIGDLHGEPLFGSAAAAPEPVLAQLIDILVPILGMTTNDIAVVGHTDATPFQVGAAYSNWELSADRANAARRMLINSGLASERIVRVSGRAATDPIMRDPIAPRNRRIAITLLRHSAN